jgi:prepilin-type N-terminal cleavage/methylation domain-containing protein
MRRRARGFTLPELMAVVAIVTIVGALAARMYSGGVRGETAPAFARSAMATFADARHNAVALGKPTRIMIAKSPMRLETQTVEPTDSTKTYKTQGSLKLPSTLQLCDPNPSVQLGASAASASCPLTTTQYLCFFTNGKVALSSTGNCTSETASGATVYFETMKADKKYKLVVWGLTGMTKVWDQW